jgi:hypothetical protein
MLKDTEISNFKHPARMTAGKQIPNKFQITIPNTRRKRLRCA